MTKCNKACQDAFIAQQIIHTDEYYATQKFLGGIKLSVWDNTPVITSVIEPNRRRSLAAIAPSVLINYDHIFSYTIDIDSSSYLGVLDLAGKPFEENSDRNTFVDDLKQANGVFKDLVEVSEIERQTTLAAPTSTPTNSPSTVVPTTAFVTSTVAPTKASGTASSATGVIEEEPLSTGAIIGIAVGGSILLLVCAGCFILSRNLTKDDERSLGGYEPPDDFSSAWSSTK